MWIATDFPNSPFDADAPRYRFLLRYQITKNDVDNGANGESGHVSINDGCLKEKQPETENADIGTIGWCMKICESVSKEGHSLEPLSMMGLIISLLQEPSEYIASVLTDKLGIPYIDFISKVIQFKKNIWKEWMTKLNELVKNMADGAGKGNKNMIEQMQLLVSTFTGKTFDKQRGNTLEVLCKIPPVDILTIIMAFPESKRCDEQHAYVHDSFTLDVEHEDTTLFEKAVIAPTRKKVAWGEEDLIRIDSLPQWTQSAFSDIERLNLVQSAVFNSAFNTSQNMLLSAPTGCGKTNVAMLCLLQSFRNHFELGCEKAKVVYIAPMKALAAEITGKFLKALKQMGLIVSEVTGDIQVSRSELFAIDILVTTPEKFDVITRNSSATGTQSDDSFLSKVSCMIIDEVHLLNDARGSVLETVVARFFRLIESTQKTRRVVAISATLPNWQDVAQFLRVSPEHAHYFGVEYRHVPLEQIYYGVKARDFEPTALNICFDHVKDVIAKGKQCIVFVHTRNDTIATAMALIEMIQKDNKGYDLFQPSAQLYTKFKKQIKSSKYEKLESLAEYCISLHHAGMLRKDRDLVEAMFKEGLIKVLVSTSTLAWGVNLPANCVIVKGTFISGININRDLNILELTQMLGRAGRPQFDKEGVGVVITEHNKLANYVRMQTERIPIESQLHRNLENALNAEVALGTISEEADALIWLQYTFLYVRIHKNPLIYGLKGTREEDVTEYLNKMVHDAAVNLDKSRLIRFHEGRGEVVSTDLGRIAAKYYVDYETVYNFALSITPDIGMGSAYQIEDIGRGNGQPETLLELPCINEAYVLERLCECKEYECLVYRTEELDELTALMENSIYKPKRGLNHFTTKVSLLIEAHINRVSLRTHSLMSDMNYIVQNTGRLLLAYFETSISDTVSGPPIGDLIYKWALMFERQLWDIAAKPRSVVYHFCYPYHAMYDTTKMKSSKLPVISQRTASRLSKYKLDTLLELDQSELADIVKSKGEGSIVYDHLRHIPYPEVEAFSVPITNRISKVSVSISIANLWSLRWNGESESFHVWICSQSRIVSKIKVVLTPRNLKDTHDILVPLRDDMRFLILKVFSCRWLGIAVEQQIVLHKYDAATDEHTKLMKILPVPTIGLREGDFQFPHRYLNPLQSQMFPHCYFSDDNLLVGAPTGSGKTVIAELAMFRLWHVQPNKKIVYIAPMKALAYERYKDWRRKFGKFKQVSEVTGDSHTTAKEIAKSNIVVTTPEKWDGISRHWNHRKYVRSVGLVIIDEVHLLGEARGGVLEAIVNRLSFISKHTDTKIRIVCLSTPLANSGEIADWLQVKRSRLFNFSSAVRPVLCNLYIDGFPIKAYCPRMNSMNKPAFSTIMRHDVDAPVLVFVSSRRQTRSTAQDFLGLLQAKSLKWGPKMELKEEFTDENMNCFVEYGIGIHHAGLHDRDRTRIEEMFLRGEIKVLIATSTLAWGVNLPAKVVIIKGTEYYDGKTKKYADYSVTDIMQMVGRAGRKLQDKEAYAYIYTESRKVDFYKAFMFSPFPAESSFHEYIFDTLNSEIASGAVASYLQTLQYIKNTFFYKKLQANKMYYLRVELLKGCNHENSPEELANYAVTRCLQGLKEMGCVSMDHNDAYDTDLENQTLFPTILGLLASQYYVGCKTMAGFITAVEQVSKEVHVMKALRIIADAKEFSEVPMRHNEDIYNMQLSSKAVMSISHCEASNPHAKTFLLLQARLFGLKLPVFDYNNDLKSVMDQVPRVLQALIDLTACYRTFKNIQYLLMLYKYLLIGGNILEQCLTFRGGIDIIANVLDIRSNKMMAVKVISKPGGWYNCDVTGIDEIDIIVTIYGMSLDQAANYLILGNDYSDKLYGFRKILVDGSYTFRLRIHEITGHLVVKILFISSASTTYGQQKTIVLSVK
ncbi:hypothetical protein BgAZ_304200 [Babesia gibsoni]|uniref:Uncharacterized protein n=1 Tax=Babesia gibsoni TaxID=33632 RepID=A0AAD8LR56_BABGI|nr:hypothetical protein BgAZ_304200 [Babesia gibsoni]